MRQQLRLWIIFCLLFISTAALAQEDTPEPSPTTPTATATVDDALARAEAAAIRAEEAADEADSRAQEAIDLAFNLLGIFEAIGFLVTVGAGLAAIFGVSRLISAQNELTRARESVERELEEITKRFEQRLSEKEEEVTKLHEELEETAARNRQMLANASLAQSLLPIGERQYRAQDFQGALDTYQRALELDPGNLILHYRIGYTYTQSGELERALEHLQRALEIDDTFAPALASLGYVYRRIGEKMPNGIERDDTLNKAERYLLEALKRSPKLIDEDGESWWGSLGGLYRRRGQIEQAIEAYKRATEVTPQSSYGWGNLALLYVQTHNREKMLETYKRVEMLAQAEALAEVDNYWGWSDLAVARLALGKEAEAQEALQRALELASPDSPYMLDMLIDTIDRLATALDEGERPPLERAKAEIRRVQAEHMALRQGKNTEAAGQ